MTIEFRCGECSKLLRTSDDKAGATARCPQCGAPVTVPAAEGAEVERLFDEPLTQPYEPPVDDEGPARPPPISSRPGGTRPCPMCGELIQAAATRCRFCGESLGPGPLSSGQRRQSAVRPHRGGMILAFGILGWAVCFIFSILAVVMGNEDLKEMQAGRMDPEGQGMTQAGRIIGLVQCALVAVMIVVFCVFAIIGGVANN